MEQNKCFKHILEVKHAELEQIRARRSASKGSGRRAASLGVIWGANGELWVRIGKKWSATSPVGILEEDFADGNEGVSSGNRGAAVWKIAVICVGNG